VVILEWIALTVIAVIACIPLFAGSGRFRPCYKGCHGCGKCRKPVQTRPAGAEDPADHGQE